MTTSEPTVEGVKQAAERLRAHMAPTPLYRSEALSRAFDGEVWLKLETATPIASFKLRGALNHLLVARAAGSLTSAVTSSTGNHGQGVAYAARLLGLKADIFLPEGCPLVKQTMIRLFGATLHVGGADIDEAKERARTFCAASGGEFVDDGESATLIEGAGTIGDEIGAGLDDVDAVFTSMGSGSLAAGTALGIKGRQPQAKVVAVQSAGSPAMVESFRAGRAIERPVDSLAESIVCRVPAATALAALIRHVDDALLVSDSEILAALHALLAWGHVLVEPGAAAGLAGAWSRRRELRGKRVVLVLSGANVDPGMIGRALAGPPLFEATGSIRSLSTD
ncbi:MAG: threonine/serine dehydratase [Dongiaceae bacterium]